MVNVFTSSNTLLQSVLSKSENTQCLLLLLNKGDCSCNPALINTIEYTGTDRRILFLDLCMFFRELYGYLQLLCNR